LYWAAGQGAAVTEQDACLLDGLLDAIYGRVSGGRRRPQGESGPYEPGLGLFGANMGAGHHRFWFVPREPVGRSDLYDRVAGLLLREVVREVVVSALYLYPPSYAIEADGPEQHAFMLLLEPRGRGAAESRTTSFSRPNTTIWRAL
jgi:hypothetical protein